MARKEQARATLLGHAATKGALGSAARTPLADRMRPRTVDELFGQEKLLGEGRWLRAAIQADRFPSLILWGPPGVGKTTLAQVVAGATKRQFVAFSAVLGGVPELRNILAEADENRRYRGLSTILFVDEIHRFNRAQQDAFLPHVERGTVTLIGATTENPSFAVNAAVLSRAKVVRLEGLDAKALRALLARALCDRERGLGESGVSATDEALALIATAAGGDARRALGLLEAAVELSSGQAKGLELTAERLQEFTDVAPLLYDKSGDEHYGIISAFIKSMRGSDPDAAIYWLMRMLDAGEEPLFLLRRMMIFASEDVGNADPRALSVAVDADAAFRRMGMPEGYYPLAHACLYLASCPKSGAVGQAWHRARALIQKTGALPVPAKLRPAGTALMKEQGHGRDYQYAHDFADGYVPGETYLPEALVGTLLYEPTLHGLEKAIGERLLRIRGEAKDTESK